MLDRHASYFFFGFFFFRKPSLKILLKISHVECIMSRLNYMGLNKPFIIETNYAIKRDN